jgi:3',5'-cyclic AMP phosphodiesterase CpdA
MRFTALLEAIREQEPDILLIGGDTGEAGSVLAFLKKIAQAVEVPIYFVLGNHDYYRGSIEKVRSQAAMLRREEPNLIWLPTVGVVELTPKVALVGHGCWGDARLGDYEGSTVILTDYLLIEELQGLEHSARGKMLRRLGHEAAEYLEDVLPTALSRYPRVFVLTHVPPFRELCRHEGELADDNWLPHFSCGAVGDLLLRVMESHQDRHLVVLSGHTHDAASLEILPNLTAHAARSQYGEPWIQRIFEVS